MNVLVLHVVSVLVLAIVVECACRLGRFRPALCHALWLVVLVKLIVPPVVAWPVTSETLATLFSAHETTNEPGTEGVGAGATRQGFMDGGWALGLGQSGVPSDTGEANGIGLEVVLLGLWALGAVAVGGRIALHVRRGRRRIAAGEALPEWLQVRLVQSCALLGVPVPHAVIVCEVGGVYMQITGRPTLVISAEALEHVGAEQWHTILTHELAHLKRRDHWVAWLMLAAGAVWWWNPCFWWVRNRVHLFSEMACDAWVVNVHPGDRKQYAETMVRIMAMLSRQEAPAPAMGLAAWSAATQERRLWMIMKAKGGSRVPWLGTVGVIAFAVLAVPGCRTTSEKGGEGAITAAKKAGWVLSLTPSDSLDAKLAMPTNIEFETIHIKDIFEFMQDTFAIDIIADQRVVKPEQKEGEAPVPDSPKGGRPYACDGLVPYINVKDTPLNEALSALARPLQLTVKTRGHSVWVSTPEQLAIDDAVPLPSADFTEGPVLDKLKSPVNIEFQEIHIKDIVQFLQDSFGINIVLDGQVIAPERGDFNAPPLGSPGYTTDGMIDYINQKSVPLGESLYVLTRLLNLSYAVTSNYVYISTPERVAELMNAASAE